MPIVMPLAMPFAMPLSPKQACVQVPLSWVRRLKYLGAGMLVANACVAMGLVIILVEVRAGIEQRWARAERPTIAPPQPQCMCVRVDLPFIS